MRKLLVLSFLIFLFSCKKDTYNTTPTKGLVAYYPFSGNTVDSINGFNGINLGATLTTDRFGRKNCSYSFNGISNHIKVPYPILGYYPCNSDFSISYWVNLSTPLNSKNISVSFSNANGTGYFNPFGMYHYDWNSKVGLTGQNLFGYWWHNTGIFTNNSTFNINTWYNITYVYYSNNNQMKVFINGVDDSGIKYNLGNSGGSDYNLGNWFVGSIGTGCYFNGKIDDIRIYNRSLDNNEIKSIYHESGYY